MKQKALIVRMSRSDQDETLEGSTLVSMSIALVSYGVCDGYGQNRELLRESAEAWAELAFIPLGVVFS